MLVVKTSKRNLFIIAIVVIVIVIIVLGLYFYPITALKKLDEMQVVSVGLAGQEDKIVYDYPEDVATELIEVIKTVKLKGFPSKEYLGVKGGGPMMATTIVFEDYSTIKLSYVRITNKDFLIINDKGYLCDSQTLDKFQKISSGCYSAYKATWYTTDDNSPN